MVDDGEIGTVKHAIEMMDTKYLAVSPCLVPARHVR
jgi:hypothetical protein